MTLYEVLGLSDQATTSEIKAAHRAAVKRHHPDAGGDPALFSQVQRAYSILSDPARRARYDSTGVEDDEPASTEQQLAHSLIANLIMQFVESADDLDKIDVVAAVRTTLSNQRNAHGIACRKIQLTIGRLATLRNRLSRSDSDMLDILMKQREESLNKTLMDEQKNLRTLDHALSLIGEYRYHLETIDETAIWSALKGGDLAAGRS